MRPKRLRVKKLEKGSELTMSDIKEEILSDVWFHRSISVPNIVNFQDVVIIEETEREMEIVLLFKDQSDLIKTQVLNKDQLLSLLANIQNIAEAQFLFHEFELLPHLIHVSTDTQAHLFLDQLPLIYSQKHRDQEANIKDQNQCLDIII